MKSPLSFRTSLLQILLSTLFISGFTALGVLYYLHVKKMRAQQPQYNIVALIQTTPDKERLKTIYLSELLKLSFDHPTNLFRFNAKEAQRILISSPLITSARVKKIPPGTIYIDYSLRKPVAYLLDFTNTAIDSEAVAFPFKPFFTPKKLPDIYLGVGEQKSLRWGQQIQGIKCRLALYLMNFISENCGSFLNRIDVSKALDDSYGQRQIVVILEDHVEKMIGSENSVTFIVPHILRLSVDNFRQELANYLALRPILREKKLEVSAGNTEKVLRSEPIIIDLRIPELAYIRPLA